MSYKLVGVQHPTSADVMNNRRLEPIVVETDDSSQLSALIADMLFDQSYIRYVLTRWGGSLYVCEPVDVAGRKYEKAKITYHPYQHLT
jgi:hypothetical protein